MLSPLVHKTKFRFCFIVLALFLFSISLISARGFDVKTNGTILVRFGNFTNLSELRDVNSSGWNDEDFLQYDSSIGLWQSIAVAPGGGGDNASWNESGARNIFIAQADESDLNVNSTSWWAGLTGLVSTWFYNNGDELDFNETKLNNTISSEGIRLGFNSTFNATYDSFTDTNFTTECGDGEYGDGDGNCYNFNDSVLALTASRTYNASSIVLEQGIHDAGDINSIQIVGDGDTYNISEEGGINSLRVNITFCDVEDIDFIAIHYWYDDGTHTLPIGLWDFNANEFEFEYGSMPSTPTYHWYSHSVLDAGTHINESGCVILQMDHDGTGISSHDLYLDAVFLLEGNQLLTVNSIFQLNDRDDPTALDWAWDKNGSKIATNNWNYGGYNQTNINWIFPEKINWTNQIVNETIFNFTDFILTIKESWLFSLFYTKAEVDNNLSLRLLATDQRYNNTNAINSVNQTIIDSNTSWLSTQNDTYDNYADNVSRNYTLDTFTNWNTVWLSTQNDTYEGYTHDGFADFVTDEHIDWTNNPTKNMNFIGDYLQTGHNLKLEAPVGSTTATIARLDATNSNKAVVLTLNGNTAGVCDYRFQTNDLNMMNIRYSGSTDIFSLLRYNSAGVFQDNVWDVAQATGKTTYNKEVKFDGVSTFTEIVRIGEDNFLGFGSGMEVFNISSDENDANFYVGDDGTFNFYNSSGLGTLRAGRYLTSSIVPDTKLKTDYLSELNNIDDWKNEDNSINYTNHYAGVQVNVVDKDRPELEYYEKEVCEYNKTTGEDYNCRDEIFNRTIYPYTKSEGALDLEKRVAYQEAMIKELNDKVERLERDVCMVHVFGWCLIG